MVGGQWLTEKMTAKNPEPFRSRKGSKGSGFLRLMVMQQLLPYSEGEDCKLISVQLNVETPFNA